MTDADERRLWERVRELPSGCWAWTGRQDPEGYGRLDVRLPGEDRDRPHLAHRLVYIAVIRGLRSGEELDHRCEHKDCVNPAHMVVMTRREHFRRHTPPRLGTGSSRLRGVSWDAARGKWRACIRVRGRQHNLGRHDSEQAAHAAVLASGL